MRYEKVEHLLRLALDMQNSFKGISIQDIQNEYEVSRRTAIRMKDMLSRIFPLEEVPNFHSKIKRWRLTKTPLTKMICFTAEEIAELERCKKLSKNINYTNSADLISDVVSKINTINSQKAMKTDVEAMLEAEGYARRQFPKRKISNETLYKISEGLKSFKYLQFNYTNKKGETNLIKVQPYGIIYGENTLLLAYNELKKGFRHYFFHMIKNITVLDEYFDKDENFNLEEYLCRSFGIYQEEPIKIKLLFSKEVADTVLEYNFHPTQKMKKNTDGSVTVNMYTGGRKEICWHLFKWGKNVKIIAPKELIKTYNELLKDALSTIN